MGPTGDGLLNMAFMPFNSSVLEIRLPPLSSIHTPTQRDQEQEGAQLPNGDRSQVGAQSQGIPLSQESTPSQEEVEGSALRRYERLARACGLVHYLLDCTNLSHHGNASASGLGPQDLFARRLSWNETVHGSQEGSNTVTLGPGGQGQIQVQNGSANGSESGWWGGTGGGNACSQEAVVGALESVQHGLLSSPWFLGRLLTEEPQGYAVGIPGTKVGSLRQRRSLERWLRCVNEKGKWALDPSPRVLPWPYRGVPDYCDAIRRNKTGAMGILESDAYARAGGLAAKWRVRHALKYVWEVPKGCGRWFPIDVRRLCKVKGAKPLRIVMVGDSLNEQLARSLVNTLVRRVPKPATWAVVEAVPQSCTEWSEQEGSRNRAPTTFCTSYTVHGSLCANLSVTFIRNDHLQVSQKVGRGVEGSSMSSHTAVLHGNTPLLLLQQQVK